MSECTDARLSHLLWDHRTQMTRTRHDRESTRRSLDTARNSMQLRREEEGDGGGARACVTFASVDRATRAGKDPRPRNFAPFDRTDPKRAVRPDAGAGGRARGTRPPVRLTSSAHLGASRAHRTGAHLCEKIAERILLGRERTRRARGGRGAVSDFYCSIALIFQMILNLK